MDFLERLGEARKQGENQVQTAMVLQTPPAAVDKAGYENLTSRQATLFFQLVNVRYENGSIILPPTRPSGNGKIIVGDAVATATLNRLLYHVHIISGDSYRIKDLMKMRVVDFL